MQHLFLIRYEDHYLDIANSFVQLAENVVVEMNERNKLEPTKRVEITTMGGCSTK